MRLLLLGFIFLLLLTLGNAWLFQREQQHAAGSSYAPVQLEQPVKTHYEWDAFVWRELAAIVISAVVFGAIASAVRAPRSKTGSTSRLR